MGLFAGGSGDHHNPVHLDVDVARAAGMDDVFAPGMLSMAFLGRLLTNNFPQGQLRSFQTKFTAITPVNCRLVCFATVASVDSDLLTIDLRVELDDGTTTLAGAATLALNDGQRC